MSDGKWKEVEWRADIETECRSGRRVSYLRDGIRLVANYGRGGEVACWDGDIKMDNKVIVKCTTRGLGAMCCMLRAFLRWEKPEGWKCLEESVLSILETREARDE